MFLTGRYIILGEDSNYYRIVFDVCDRIVCINISVFTDNIVENNDMIFVYLIAHHRLISHNVPFLVIEVQDNDYGE